jgi:hypothetical protein
VYNLTALYKTDPIIFRFVLIQEGYGPFDFSTKDTLEGREDQVTIGRGSKQDQFKMVSKTALESIIHYTKSIQVSQT